MTPRVAQPEISGDADLDVRLTPTSTYSLTNEVFVTYTLEPEEAGTITGDYDDGKTIDIDWSENYKGEAILTATPIAECNNGPSSFTITVKNSTDVAEFGVSRCRT